MTHMDELYLSSDLVVSRAGAITCSELMATGACVAPRAPGPANDRARSPARAPLTAPAPAQGARRSSCRRRLWRTTTRASTLRLWRAAGRRRRSRTACTRRRCSQRRSPGCCRTRTALLRCAGWCVGSSSRRVNSASLSFRLAPVIGLTWAVCASTQARAESKMNSADVIAAEAIRIASRRLRTGATASRQLVPLGAMGNAMVRAAVAEAAASVAAASASAAATAPAPPRSSHSPLLQQQPREASRPALAPSAGHAPLRKQQDGVAAAHWLSRQLPSSRGDVEDAGRRLRQTIEHFSLRMATPVTGSGGAGRRAPSGAEAPEVALGLAGAPSPAGGEESPNQQKQSQAGLIV